MSESDINSFDLRSIQQSLEEIRVATDSTNTRSVLVLVGLDGLGN